MRNALFDFLDYQKENPQHTNKETLVESFMEESGYLETNVWSKGDIKGRAEELEIPITEEQVDEVADLIHNGKDAAVGMNWEVMTIWIQEATRKR